MFHPLFTNEALLGEQLLKLGVKSATFLDATTNDIYVFHATSETEFQFGKSGNTLTNYVIVPTEEYRDVRGVP